MDPWQDYIKPVSPPGSLLKADAPEFIPGDSACPLTLKTIQLMQDLIEKQNATISALAAQVEMLTFSQAMECPMKAVDAGDSYRQLFDERLSSLESNIDKLRDSLGNAVQASIEKRLPAASGGADCVNNTEVNLELEQRIHSQVMLALEGPVSQLLHGVANNFQIALDGLDSKLKTGLRYSLQELDRINAAIDNKSGLSTHHEIDRGTRIETLREADADARVPTLPLVELLAHSGDHKSRCTMSQFLEMSREVKRRIPHLVQDPLPALLLRDATDLELIHLVHEERQRWGRRHNFGPYSFQQAMCLYLASHTHLGESRAVVLEELAKQEDRVRAQHAVHSQSSSLHSLSLCAAIAAPPFAHPGKCTAEGSA